MSGARGSITIVAVWILGSLLAGCGGKSSAGNEGNPGTGQAAPPSSETVVITDQARQEAQEMFSTRCAACHGSEGRGDGPGAASLVPKPRNYHNPAWQDSVTDKEIESAILYGGAAVGRSPAMIANPDLGSKPEVVAALREIVRKFGKQP